MQTNVFETLLIMNGQPIEAESHIQRMRTATGVDMTLFLYDQIKTLTGCSRLRIDCDSSKTLSAISASLPIPDLFNHRLKVLALKTAHFGGLRLNNGYGSLKIADRTELEAFEAKLYPALPLFVSGSNEVFETSRHNVFIIENKQLVTPPLDGRILPGVTRQAVLGLARQKGIAYKEEPISLTRLLQSQTVLLTSSIIGIGVVNKCDNVAWSNISDIATVLLEGLIQKWL